jgi:hypothetical protein
MEQRLSAECDVFSGSGNQIKSTHVKPHGKVQKRSGNVHSSQDKSPQTKGIWQKAMTRSSQEEKGSGHAVLNDGMQN